MISHHYDEHPERGRHPGHAPAPLVTAYEGEQATTTRQSRAVAVARYMRRLKRGGGSSE